MEIYIAVWGVGSLFIGILAALALIISGIWGLDFAVKVAGTVLFLALFSLLTALWVQAAIDHLP